MRYRNCSIILINLLVSLVVNEDDDDPDPDPLPIVLIVVGVILLVVAIAVEEWKIGFIRNKVKSK